MPDWLHRAHHAKRRTQGKDCSTSPKSEYRQRIDFERLEDRTTPTVSAITSNFNGTAIPAGDSLWFSSVAKVSGVPADGATVHITDATITAPVLGTVSVPDATIVFDPAATSASASFDGSAWKIVSPVQYSGNVFLDGVAASLPGGLPGGIKNVVWSGDYTADKPGLSINWQWTAAAYTSFSADEAALGVKPSDAKTPLFQNSDHAGTPENFKSFVTGGARGGGGSNFTGSYSGTGKVIPSVEITPPPPTTASLSGFVYFDRNVDGVRDDLDGILSGVTITLNDAQGLFVAQTSTEADGSYSFTDLAAGTYSITETQPATLLQGTNNVGSLGGSVAGDTFTVIVGAGANGTGYNFGEVFNNDA